ncbi:MAG: geranylgeranylglycerol-phosphate geranylgeranyltransferase [Candidatus Aenigmarchaeota archaeon]|nr:geranylgeranylglycerol-phosphate geranylgeranyltransferase [Candidatus Aenigmarchaeota archaeon]
MAFAYLTILRPINSIMAAIAVYIASLVAGMPASPDILVIYAMLSVFFVSGAGMVINDIFDVEIDRVNRPERPLPSGRISLNAAKAYAAVLFAAGIAIGFLVNATAFAIATAASLLLVAYAWKLKKMMLVGHAAVSMLVALSFIYGGIVNGNHAPVLPLAALAFLANMGREIYKSVDDMMGDGQHGVTSLAVKYGVNKARTVAAALLLLAIMFSFVPFGLGIFGYVYMLFAIVADMVFLAAIAMTGKSAKLCKIAMNVALIAFLAGVLAK